jgi:hypothetical protein
MARPSTREEFSEYCLRKLGHPDPIKIPISDEQVDDCIDEAVQYWNDFHFDGTEKWYISHQVTAGDLANTYITLSDDIIGVTKVFPVGTGSASINMFDLRYQLRLHDLYDFTNTSYVNYVLTMQHIRTLEMLFSGETLIRFNRHTHKLLIDTNWAADMKEGEYIAIEGYKIVDEDAYGDMWNDRMLKQLCVARIKQVWGNNTKKYKDVKLLGGAMMAGWELYAEATDEIEKIEQLIRDTYEAPPSFIVA